LIGESQIYSSGTVPNNQSVRTIDVRQGV